MNIPISPRVSLVAAVVMTLVSFLQLAMLYNVKVIRAAIQPLDHFCVWRNVVPPSPLAFLGSPIPPGLKLAVGTIHYIDKGGMSISQSSLWPMKPEAMRILSLWVLFFLFTSLYWLIKRLIKPICLIRCLLREEERPVV